MTRTPLFWDFGPFGTRRCGVLNDSCCGSLSSPWFWFPLPNVSLLRPAVQVVTTETVMSAFALTVSSTGNFNICILDHIKKFKYIAFVGAVLSFSFVMSESAENRGGTGPARLQGRRRSSVSQQTQQSRQSGVVETPQIQS